MKRYNFLLDFNQILFKRFKNKKEGDYDLLVSFPSTISLYPQSRVDLDNFIDELIDVLDIISNIFYFPYIKTITLETIKRNELVSEFDTDSFYKTMKDASLWKQKRSGKMSPELVYTIEHEDTYVNYENIFVIFVFKRVIELINTFKELSITYSNSLKNYYGTSEASLSRMSMYANIFKNKDELSNYIFYNGENEYLDKLIKIHNKVKHLKLHKFYSTLKDYKFNLPVNLTNVLLHDYRYNRVYRFYKDNLAFEDEDLTFDKLFYNYTLIRFINYLKSNKKVKILNNITLYRNKKEGLINLVDPIKFTFNKFEYELNTNPYEYMMSLKTTYLGIETKTFIKVIYAYKDTDYVENVKLIRDYDNYLVITHNNLSLTYNNISELNFEKELYTDLIFENIILSTEIILPLTSNSLLKCPYCGKTNLIENNNNYHCTSCNNEFLTLNINHKIHVWLKSLYKGS